VHASNNSENLAGMWANMCPVNMPRTECSWENKGESPSVPSPYDRSGPQDPSRPPFPPRYTISPTVIIIDKHLPNDQNSYFSHLQSQHFRSQFRKIECSSGPRSVGINLRLHRQSKRALNQDLLLALINSRAP